MESTKCAGVEVVNVVCKVQAHHTKYAQYMHGRDQRVFVNGLDNIF